ncbi:hypothetical protein A8H39_01830 [Paraburkholderia fungorum]|uniref:hypothetical protein n=1 Tax=Paraburkholderia fungorum TaxID=134537 RepID=UPI000480BA11|nr:hypothetical protein [Paraburkholderia fungorum]PNE59911.1 hypothetical protein A8H39_01830 [Paraburkholderia fungorum]
MALQFFGVSGAATVGSDDGPQHVLIIGSTAKGKSRLLEEEAKRLGITTEELERRLEPSDAEKEQMRMQRDAEEQREEQRLQAIREATWDAYSDDDSEFSRIHDALAATVVDGVPSASQVKVLFMILPASIIGQGIAWGFTDTEVGDQIYRFVEENDESVRAALNKAQD